MFIKKATGPRTAHLPDGSVLTFADLPPPDTRWVASRKAAVVCAVAHGLITRDAALRRWHLTEEELAGWTTAHARHGLRALKVTHLQKYRQPQIES
jgi:hypothetical protein